MKNPPRFDFANTLMLRLTQRDRSLKRPSKARACSKIDPSYIIDDRPDARS
jgi:hypothetical protein